MNNIRRAMMAAGRGGASHEYVDVYMRIYPSNGFVNGRDSFFLYLKETLSVGTMVRVSLTFTAMDSTVTYLQLKPSAAGTPGKTVTMPVSFFDVEFVLSSASTNIIWCYFDKNVSNVQLDKSKIIIEKVI